ncbi:uncharacterized protein Triagg1_7120 [Trichoderma aggressivum f. europaeum]|uniref:Uncharacterized protein n=1 Tax=Trichoderma aggressivum f. europaeum TaxID=173218 RepID=A0AAE1IAA1_9HYPO|nr:hypothetical protein Triagg1_7120 [Trichoderma aggressivum f. europaeum]
MTRLPKNPVDMKSPSLLKTSRDGRSIKLPRFKFTTPVLIWPGAVFGNCLMPSQAHKASCLLSLRQSSQLNKHQAAIKDTPTNQAAAHCTRSSPSWRKLLISSLAESYHFPRSCEDRQQGSANSASNPANRRPYGLLMLPEALDCSQHA